MSALGLATPDMRLTRSRQPRRGSAWLEGKRDSALSGPTSKTPGSVFPNAPRRPPFSLALSHLTSRGEFGI